MKTKLHMETTPAIGNTIMKLALVGTVMVMTIFAALKLCSAALAGLQ